MMSVMVIKPTSVKISVSIPMVAFTVDAQHLDTHYRAMELHAKVSHVQTLTMNCITL